MYAPHHPCQRCSKAAATQNQLRTSNVPPMVGYRRSPGPGISLTDRIVPLGRRIVKLRGGLRLGRMPERLDQVTVTTSRGSVSLPWASRDLLLGEIRHLESAAAIVKAFTDVGASRPVTLSKEDRARLFELLEAWSHRVTVSVTGSSTESVVPSRATATGDRSRRGLRRSRGRDGSTASLRTCASRTWPCSDRPRRDREHVHARAGRRERDQLRGARGSWFARRVN